MYKKVFVLAILALAASAISNEDAMRKKLFAQAKAQFKGPHAKRDTDTCNAIKCGKKGEKCDANTICPDNTDCKDGICRYSIAGEECSFNYECDEDHFYCGYPNRTCKAYAVEGDSCSSTCETKDGDPTLVCDSDTNKCKVVKAKPWEPCTPGVICTDGSECTAKWYSSGVCAIIPSSVGAKCNDSYGCDFSKYLYCDSETSKCVEFPKVNQKCYGFCNKGLYCDITSETGVCKALKGKGETCTDEECKVSLSCKNGKCVSMLPGDGEYCDDNIECDESEYKCVNSVCTKKTETCTSAEDCPYGDFSYCDEGKCKGNMGLKEGDKCVINTYDDGFKYFYASMQCEEGLGCVPNAHGELEGTCKKVTADGKETCESDDDCPIDSFCACDDEIGASKCHPIFTSSKDFANKVNKYSKAERTCYDKFSVEDEGAAYLTCALGEVAGYYEYLQNTFRYLSDVRCLDLSFLGAASTVKVSVIAMVATLLFALFF